MKGWIRNQLQNDVNNSINSLTAEKNSLTNITYLEVPQTRLVS